MLREGNKKKLLPSCEFLNAQVLRLMCAARSINSWIRLNVSLIIFSVAPGKTESVKRVFPKISSSVCGFCEESRKSSSAQERTGSTLKRINRPAYKGVKRFNFNRP